MYFNKSWETEKWILLFSQEKNICNEFFLLNFAILDTEDISR